MRRVGGEGGWGLVWFAHGGVSLCCGLDGVVFRFRIVREFCFVKCDAREDVFVGRGRLDSRLRGNDGGGSGNDMGECGNDMGECGNDMGGSGEMTWVSAGIAAGGFTV